VIEGASSDTTSILILHFYFYFYKLINFFYYHYCYYYLADYISKSRDQLRLMRRGGLLGIVAEERLEIRGLYTLPMRYF